MSVKLYYQDSFMKEFTAKVVSCTEDKKGWAVILDKTAFYPEGGGQPCDHGIMTYDETSVNVIDVREKNGEVIHYVDAPIAQNTEIYGTIDWDRRFDFMQQHTGEHMFSGVVHSMFGYNNVGFHLNERENVVDFDGPLTAEEIKNVMDKCNEIVWLDQPIVADFPDSIEELSYRSKKELHGEIRIVRAGEADICACCGTHTHTTSQAGPIVALTQQAYKGGTRIHILCGKRAVEYLKHRNDDCYDISHLLSVPVESIKESLSARLKEIDDLRFALSQSKRQLMSVYAEKVQIDDESCVMAMDNLTSNELQTLALILSEKAKTAIAYTKVKDANGKICIVSKDIDTNKLGRFISSHLGGKGGGKPGIYQGFVEKDTDENQLKSLVKEFSKQM